MIGRIVPNKRLEEAIEIVQKVRDVGLDVKLTIVGRVNTGYGRRFVRKWRLHPWVTVVENASSSTKNSVLSQATLGLHTYQHEHFGIAVGEMIHAGVLPVVFDGGGVVELAFDPALRFVNKMDAAQKIVFLLAAPSEYKNELVRRLHRGAAVIPPFVEAFGTRTTRPFGTGLVSWHLNCRRNSEGLLHYFPRFQPMRFIPL
ncbi:MAG: glycosyltransferase involved in cell wall biosynthesis [Planctomycetota bacterium]|jgi:glycosyltransferase involved in cell wall biosynthesis